MSRLGLNREVLANITNGNQEAIKALEGIFNDVNVTMPEQIAAAINQAAQAVAAANQALGILLNAVDGLAHLANAPAAIQAPEYEDMRPAIQVGSISIQEADNVEITGGTIGLSAGAVALPSFYLVDRTTGLYRIGAANLGLAIAGVKLMSYAAGLVTVTGAERTVAPSYAPGAGYSASFESNSGTSAGQVQFGADEAGGYTWQRTLQQGVGAVPHRFYLFNTLYMTLNTSGLTIVGNVSVNAQLVSTVAVGTPPLSVVSTTMVPNLYVRRALEADGLTSPSALAPVATDLPTVITLANSLRAAAAAKGL